MKLPKEVFVRVEGEGDEAFLVAHAEAGEFAEAGRALPAGLYRLVEKVTVSADISIDKVG